MPKLHDVTSPTCPGLSFAACVACTLLFLVVATVVPEFHFDIAAGLLGITSLLFLPATLKKCVFRIRTHLAQKQHLISRKAFVGQIKASFLVLGKGFQWNADCAQMESELRSQHADVSLPIHALHHAKNVWAQKKQFSTHSLIFGTTGSGKSRLLDSLVTQAIKQGDSVIFIDPKGDEDLAQNIRVSCELCGRASDFCLFSPFSPKDSVTLKLTASVSSASEMADMLCATLPRGPGSDVFTAFVWNSVFGLASGLIALNQRPNFLNLRESFQDVGKFAQQVLSTLVFKELNTFDAEILKQNLEHVSSSKALRLLTDAFNGLPSEAKAQFEGIPTLISLANRSDDQAKLTASLEPLLTKLTSGNLPEMLGGAAEDRKSISVPDVILKGKVLFVSIDARKSPTLARGINSMLLTAIALYSGTKQHLQKQMRIAPLTLVIDEASEATCDGLITILNKGRSAEISTYLATQTYADFVSALGSDAEATRVLANANNVFALRCLDAKTQQFLTASSPEVEIASLAIRNSGGVEDSTSTISSEIKTSKSPLVRSSLLGELPDLEAFYFAKGRVSKLKIPILTNN